VAIEIVRYLNYFFMDGYSSFCRRLRDFI